MHTHALLLLLSLTLLAACGAPEPLRPPHPTDRLTEALRPTDTGSNLMWRYQASDTVESFAADGGAFRVHFTRAGVNAVPSADQDGDGVPDFVQAVSQVYESVGDTYHATLGFRRPLSDEGLPDNGGDGHFDVYLLDFALSADGAYRVDTCPSGERCVGYVVQENDFAGYGYPSLTEATTILGSHEYFHAIQAAYDNAQDVVITEGTAVWATERYAPHTSDFENFIHGYLDRPERSLDSAPPGPVPTFAYGSAVFFQYLSEVHGDDVIRQLWEHLENGAGDPGEPTNQANPAWLVQLDALLGREYQSSFADDFARFAMWNLYLGSAADPTKAYAHAETWPQPAMTRLDAPVAKPGLRMSYASAQYFQVPSAGRGEMTAALVDEGATGNDELAGLRLALVTRKSGVNLDARTVADVSAPTAAEALDTSSGADLLVAVINTARAGDGSILSKRPKLCAGTPAEVDACRSPDAGVDGGVDLPDAGSEESPPLTAPASDDVLGPAQGCGCGATAGGPWLVLLVGAALRRRSRTRSRRP